MWVKDSARVARTRTRSRSTPWRLLVRATLAVALGASSRDIHSTLIHTLLYRLWGWPPSGPGSINQFGSRVVGNRMGASPIPTDELAIKIRTLIGQTQSAHDQDGQPR